ncbi:hypothetical protein [Hoeflea ulvae]|uniref:Uncharacterized protein n=1 Tax=Hoeflea ulvae TaxID=2983764 RepID=A0ABT3YHE3_9HYPH|nr:hypothetical protein [Hoeflea ulvae]MCY0095232.1 hypothetical protein [Hoeflea ulvae]
MSVTIRFGQNSPESEIFLTNSALLAASRGIEAAKPAQFSPAPRFCCISVTFAVILRVLPRS